MNEHFTFRTNCPCCHAGSFRTLYESVLDSSPIKDYLNDFYSPQGGVEFAYLKDAVYRLCECTSCQAIFQQEIPNDTLLEKLYEEWLDPQLALLRHQKQDGLAYHRQHAEEIMQVIALLGKPPAQLHFLDFGMGWGQWALMAKAFGCTAYGTELSRERIAHARANGIHVITWEQLPRPQFDFINTEQVFEHLAAPLDTLRYISRGLKPGGLLKISVPTAHNIKRRLAHMDWKTPKGTRLSLNPVAPLEHINFFRRKSLLCMAEAAGMKEVTIPLKIQYQHTLDVSGLKPFVKSVSKPIIRKVWKQPNYLFFRKT
ncbi:class I SAM-dependent methyltransferase [Flavisolibacter nicotianae]|uniref:class I SAM-dependent methyltransferase n=1 Tax=Flavisolibacter nicotianae TaxID=2364882 RepID=UPI000EAECC34|nr:class I SAM-dependent methyltransferase [Flavisolibacter nicotianae]